MNCIFFLYQIFTGACPFAILHFFPASLLSVPRFSPVVKTVGKENMKEQQLPFAGRCNARPYRISNDTFGGLVSPIPFVKGIRPERELCRQCIGRSIDLRDRLEGPGCTDRLTVPVIRIGSARL